MVGVLGSLFRTAGHTVRTQHGVTASAGQRRGDVESATTCAIKRAAGAWSSTCPSRTTALAPDTSSHVKQNGLLSHPQDLDAPLRLAAQRKINGYRQRYADNQNISFLPSIVSTCHIHPHARLVFASSFSTGPPGDRGEFHCRWNVITTQQIGLVPFQARGILPVAEEQSRTRGGQSSGGITDQPQCRGLWHSSSPSARSLSRSPSSPFPSFTQSPSPPRSLVRDGQTSPHRPRLVVSRSTCPPLSPCPHANSFVVGTAVINTHGPPYWIFNVVPRPGCVPVTVTASSAGAAPP
jgi:hypothetical protein